MTEVWRSTDLGLVILSKSSDPVAGERVRRYTKILADVEVDPIRFTVPPDYQIERENARQTASLAM